MSTTTDSKIRIQLEDFSVTDEIEAMKKVSRNIGGITTFLGTGRELSKGENITQLNFEHYPKMAEKKLEEIHISRQAYLQRFRKLTGDARGAGGRKQLCGGSGAEQASSQSHGWCAGVVASRGVGKLVPPLSDCLWVGGRASGPGNQLSERAIKKDNFGIGRPTGGRPARRAIWAD